MSDSPTVSAASTPCTLCALPLERYVYGPENRYVRAYRLRRKQICHACYMARRRKGKPNPSPVPSYIRASQAKAARAYAAHLSGTKLTAIANQFHTTPRQVSRWLRSHEATVAKRLNKASAQQAAP